MNQGKTCRAQREIGKDAKEDGSGECSTLAEHGVPEDTEGINRNELTRLHTGYALNRSAE